MARTQTLVQLTDELIANLDRYAAANGKSRSAVIREAVEEYLSSTREAEITAQLIAGYERTPQNTVDEWGDLTEQLRYNAQRTLERLEAEERESGNEW